MRAFPTAGKRNPTPACKKVGESLQPSQPICKVPTKHKSCPFATQSPAGALKGLQHASQGSYVRKASSEPSCKRTPGSYKSTSYPKQPQVQSGSQKTDCFGEPRGCQGSIGTSQSPTKQPNGVEALAPSPCRWAQSLHTLEPTWAIERLGPWEKKQGRPYAIYIPLHLGYAFPRNEFPAFGVFGMRGRVKAAQSVS